MASNKQQQTPKKGKNKRRADATLSPHQTGKLQVIDDSPSEQDKPQVTSQLGNDTIDSAMNTEVKQINDDNAESTSNTNTSEQISDETNGNNTDPIETDHIEESQHIFVCYIKGVNTNIAQIAQQNPIKFREEFISHFGEPIDVQIHYKTKCIKVYSNLEVKQLLLQQSELLGYSIQVSEPYQSKPQRTFYVPNASSFAFQNQYKAIIFHVPEDLSEEEICSATEAKLAKRISKPSMYGNRIPTTSVILTFNDQPPSNVYIGFSRYQTQTYVPKPIRCNKCQKFGHVTSKCTTQLLRCSYCTGSHSYDNCTRKQNDSPPVCANCNGTHSSAYSKCPKFIEIKQALEIRATERISYKEALQKVKSNTSHQQDHETLPKRADASNSAPQHQPYFQPNSELEEKISSHDSLLQSLRGALDAQAIQIEQLTEQVHKLKTDNDKLLLSVQQSFVDFQTNFINEIFQKQFLTLKQEIVSEVRSIIAETSTRSHIPSTIPVRQTAQVSNKFPPHPSSNKNAVVK